MIAIYIYSWFLSIAIIIAIVRLIIIKKSKIIKSKQSKELLINEIKELELQLESHKEINELGYKLQLEIIRRYRKLLGE